MINRSLIRIKTVQILYSYLLTRSEFKLQPAPGPEASRDKRFAYTVYLDMMLLLLKLSSQPLGPNCGIMLAEDAGLKKNRIASAMRHDLSVIDTVLNGRRGRLAAYDSCLEDLAAALRESAVYKDYKRKRKLKFTDDVAFWSTVFSTIVRRFKGVERVLRRDEDFSHVGFDMGVNMFVATLSGFDDSRATYLKARADLDESLSLAYKLYHALLQLPVLITSMQEQRLDAAKHKFVPTPDDLNPNMRFVDNKFVEALRNCEALQNFIKDNPDADPSTWRDADVLCGSLLNRILQSEAYADYMALEESDFATDANFWREIMRNIVFSSDELADALENRSVFWNDDLAIMSTFALKTIKRSYSPAADEDSVDVGRIVLLPKFMNEADERFGAELFEYVVNNREQYRAYVDRFINPEQWDTERLAYMDIVVLLTAIAEIINYPSIPVPVTLNEYIEIANDYSTPRSGQFVNGILSSVIKLLEQEGVINKQL